MYFIHEHLRADDDTRGGLGISSFLREPVWQRNILAPEIVLRTSLATEYTRSGNSVACLIILKSNTDQIS